LRYKVDSNHDIVYLDFDEPTLTIQESARDLSETEPRAAHRGRRPAGIESESKTQPLHLPNVAGSNQ